MFTALLLAVEPATSFHWPTVLAIVLGIIGSAAGIERVYGWITGGTSARLAKLETAMASFVPEPDIKAKNEELGRQIAELQGKIKTYHDAGESNYNALNMRVTALEQHNTSLTLLPAQVQKLNTDHAVLANEVRTLSNNIEKLSDKQDGHFNELMHAVRTIAFTQGQMQGGARPPIPLSS